MIIFLSDLHGMSAAFVEIFMAPSDTSSSSTTTSSSSSPPNSQSSPNTSNTTHHPLAVFNIKTHVAETLDLKNYILWGSLFIHVLKAYNVLNCIKDTAISPPATIQNDTGSSLPNFQQKKSLPHWYHYNLNHPCERQLYHYFNAYYLYHLREKCEFINGYVNWLANKMMLNSI